MDTGRRAWVSRFESANNERNEPLNPFLILTGVVFGSFWEDIIKLSF